MSSSVSLTSWGKGASLVLVGYPCSDGMTIKIPYGIDVYCIGQPRAPPFPTGLVKYKSDFIVTSVETGLGR